MVNVCTTPSISCGPGSLKKGYKAGAQEVLPTGPTGFAGKRGVILRKCVLAFVYEPEQGAVRNLRALDPE